mgnify:CR=1 FL=1
MTSTAMTAPALKDLYEIGEIPPAYHVPARMHAWTIRKERHGRPNKAMQLEVVETPTIGEDEVLVLVMAAGVNYNGVWAALGEPISPLDGHKHPYHIAGSDASGIVWAVGAKVKRWKEAAAALSNVEVLPATCSLAEALEQASLVVNIMSNAVIEAALARRPVLYVNASGEPDIFAQERFLGPCISSTDDLQQAVVQVELNRDHAIRQGTLFAEHHLAHGCQGLAWSVQALLTLLENRPPQGVSVTLTSTIEQ